MNIIFMGTPGFAVPALKALLDSKHKILAVVTVPNKPKGRGLKLSQSEVKLAAEHAGLNILQPDKLNDPAFINSIKQLNPDLIIVVAFRILPKEIFKIPKFGSINLHASLLPKYRGAAPINWAIINGEIETGVTTFFLREKVDTGTIILQEKCIIEKDDDAGILHDKLSALGAGAILETIELIESSSGNVNVINQDEAASSSAPKIFREMCKINWNKTAGEIYNFIRGLSPYPSAFSVINGKTLKIFKAAVAGIDNLFTPGKVLVKDNKIFVKCGNGSIEILELQLEGKKRISAAEFLKGNLSLIDGAILT